MSLSFETDEEKARIYSELLISTMGKRDGKEKLALYSRYETYVRNFFTIEEIQEKEEFHIEEESRMSKTETKFIFKTLVNNVNDTVRLKGYERYSKTCAAERKLAEKEQKPRLTDAEIEELCKPSNKKKKKKKAKKKDLVVTEISEAVEESDVEADIFACAEAEPNVDEVVHKYSPKQISSPDIWESDISRYQKRPMLLFSLFYKGIKLDREAWYSVTPELIARHQAQRCKGKRVIDAFSGVGGNTIQFAKLCPSVIAIDIDPKKIEMGKHNAEIYNVVDKIEYITGDFVSLAPTLKLKADTVFLSPPWGGPDYERSATYKLEMLQPGGCLLFQTALSITSNIIMYVPKNCDEDQLKELAQLTSPPLDVKIEVNTVEGKPKAITAYYCEKLEAAKYQPPILARRRQ